jgi:hypothetical protein
MFFRAKQHLDRLPHDPSFGLESRYCRVGECNGVWQGLQTVQTAQRFVNKGDACAWRTQEKLVIIPIQVSIEARQLRRCQIRVVSRFVVLVLCMFSV